MDARRVENDLKRKGLDPHLAYDPASPYFLGDPKRIAKWSSSMQQDCKPAASFRAIKPALGNLCCQPSPSLPKKTLPAPKVGDVK